MDHYIVENGKKRKVSEEKINLEKVLKEIREAWKETKEHFKIEGDLKIRIKTEDGNILEVLDDE